MSSYKNFQSDNMKYDYKETRTNIFNPNFTPTVSAKGLKQEDSFTKNLNKWKDFVSWCLWMPDLFLDLITPEQGGIRLDLDQRVFLRSLTRFLSVYGVFPRGWSKTFLEVLGSYIVCTFIPDIDIALTAQTKDNAAGLVEAKHREIIRFYPLLANEVVKSKFQKDSVEVLFSSGGRLDVLANSQSSKGNRRKRLQIEESALLNNDLFQDALEPIVNIPRRTIGKMAIVNPEELNGQINFFTTSGFRGSDEFERNILMVDDMAELKGKIVIGSDWKLACGFGRGETKSQILDKKTKLSPIFFAQNYESKWVGCVDNALVDINKLLNLRSLSKAKIKAMKKEEIILGIDVARSQDTSNNQSSVSVLEIKRNKNNKITQIMLINIVNISNALNFTAQAIEIKKIKQNYNAKMVVVDSNGLGVGLVDELMKETFDVNTGESLGCWDTVNTEAQPEVNNAEKCIFDLKPQSANSEVIVSFIDMVESGKLRLLVKKTDADYDINDKDNYIENVLPFVQTDFFVEEVSNLQLKHMNSGKVTVEKVIKRINKDRYSATAYGLWYIKNFEDNVYQEELDEFEILSQCTGFY